MRPARNEVTATASPTARTTRSEETRKIRVASDSERRRRAGLVAVLVTAGGEVGLAVLVEVRRDLGVGDLDAGRDRRRAGHGQGGGPGIGLLVPDGELAGA